MDVLAVVMLVLVVVVNGGDSILGGSLVNIILVVSTLGREGNDLKRLRKELKM